uniref:Uncharacterized protein n=1 Tax=Globisporangium ultimum (strain ATCC 200006 / CBS 805.95 / DAOM BR144) TaxID=431595 RepID=K3WY20_GLOUD
MSKAERPRATASLHAFLVPGMLDTTIPEGLELLLASCDEIQESTVPCRRLHERLAYLRQQVEDRPLATRLQRSTIVKYGACVGDCIRLLTKRQTFSAASPGTEGFSRKSHAFTNVSTCFSFSLSW